VAQSWAATWHPVIGSWVLCKSYGLAGSRTRDLPSGQRTSRAGLTTRPTGGTYYINDKEIIYVWFKFITTGERARA
jgi:hypothetical protein